MKRIFLLVLLVCVYSISYSQSKNQPNDGLYLVDKVLNDTNVVVNTNQKLVYYNSGFIEDAPAGSIGLLIQTNDFVPLELEKEPVLIKANNKNKLELTFSRPVSEKLERFTTDHLMKQATLVVNGEALTMHKIRAVISGGKMEITGSSDKACQHIYETLTKNVKGSN